MLKFCFTFWERMNCGVLLIFPTWLSASSGSGLISFSKLSSLDAMPEGPPGVGVALVGVSTGSLLQPGRSKNRDKIKQKYRFIELSFSVNKLGCGKRPDRWHCTGQTCRRRRILTRCDPQARHNDISSIWGPLANNQPDCNKQ